MLFLVFVMVNLSCAAHPINGIRMKLENYRSDVLRIGQNVGSRMAQCIFSELSRV